MKPLEEFICDICKTVIKNPKEGYVEWLSADNDQGEEYEMGFRIVHNVEKCFSHEGMKSFPNVIIRSLPLHNILGPAKIPEILSFLDIGPVFSPDFKPPYKLDMRDFIEFVRRITIPYFEEARIYFDTAIADGFFAGENAISCYLPDKLQKVIEKYSKV